MATTREDISRWFDRGVSQGSTHLIIVCDMWDYEDYPVFVQSGENVREEASKYNPSNMEKVMEVYNLSQDKEKQLNEYRAFNF